MRRACEWASGLGAEHLVVGGGAQRVEPPGDEDYSRLAAALDEVAPSRRVRARRELPPAPDHDRRVARAGRAGLRAARGSASARTPATCRRAAATRSSSSGPTASGSTTCTSRTSTRPAGSCRSGEGVLDVAGVVRRAARDGLRGLGDGRRRTAGPATRTRARGRAWPDCASVGLARVGTSGQRASRLDPLSRASHGCSSLPGPTRQCGDPRGRGYRSRRGSARSGSPRWADRFGEPAAR